MTEVQDYGFLKGEVNTNTGVLTLDFYKTEVCEDLILSIECQLKKRRKLTYECRFEIDDFKRTGQTESFKVVVYKNRKTSSSMNMAIFPRYGPAVLSRQIHTLMTNGINEFFNQNI